jgi:hypothetical protein
MLRKMFRKLIFINLLAWSSFSMAYTATITAGAKSLYLQVGTGGMVGNFSSGGTPNSNTTINEAATSVPAASLGNSTVQPFTLSAPLSSALDGFAFCNANQLYVAGFNRRPTATASTAVMTVTAPLNLTNATGEVIPFSEIQWASSGNGDAGATIAVGSFIPGGSLTLYTFPTNQWAEGCLSFSYKNTKIVAAGVYTGRVTYTLSTP